MHDFQNKTLSAEKRADILLSELTTEEKVAMLSDANPAIPRLGIPEYHWWNEGLHGVARNGKATMFPQAIALAATFSPEFAFEMGKIIAEEARIKHFHYAARGWNGTYSGLTMFAPNINIFRDPRWGRGHETYGECPVLTSLMGDAYVRGIQGPDPEHMSCAATLKHFAAHSGPEASRAEFNSKVSRKDLAETYLHAFRHCVRKSKAAYLMTAYNALNGTPTSMSSALLRKLLREEWGFEGVVVTDVGTAENLVNAHKTCSDMAEAYALEVAAGVDVCCELRGNVLDAWNQGLLKEADVDNAVRRQLLLKFRLGLFDQPEELPNYNRLECAAFRSVSRKIAERSMVLLKNDGILPLDPKTKRKIAVIGPTAADIDILKGNYSGTATKYATLLDGLLEACGEDSVIYARGCEITRSRTEMCSEDDDRLAEARTAADHADLVVLCLGLTPEFEGEIGDASNSDAAGDKNSLELPTVQSRLLDEVRAADKPVILLHVSGSAMVIPEEKVDAVLQIFYPGPEGGRVAADILFGRVNPSGRLPVTFYRSTSDLPPFDDYSMENRTYRFFQGTPQYPFGYGLSYTKFTFSDLSVPAEIGSTDALNCVVTVRNEGALAGEVAALFFFRHEDAPFRTPLRQFAGAVRVSLEPGEEKRASFEIPAELFEIADDDGVFHALPGRVTVMVEDLHKEAIRLPGTSWRGHRATAAPAQRNKVEAT